MSSSRPHTATLHIRIAAHSQELVLEDALGGKAKKTLLYKLSESAALAHFKRVVLVSSPKDQYVPSYSARIQVSGCCCLYSYSTH